MRWPPISRDGISRSFSGYQGPATESIQMLRLSSWRICREARTTLQTLSPLCHRCGPRETETMRSRRPRVAISDFDLSRLSERTRELVLFGDKAGRYASRSEADFAACLGMFAAGFEEAEVWAAMMDPAHGISEKFLEKGRGGERYLSLTIGKAAAKARASRLRVGRSKARRVRRRVA
jgi:hypothetical protein